MSDISEWDAAAANNNDAPPDGFPENMLPGKVNDSAREVMAAISRWYQDLQGTLETAGSSNAYTVTTNNTYAALSDQGLLLLEIDRDNTGAATLNVDGLGAKSFYKSQPQQEWASGELKDGQIILVGYNHTDDYYFAVNPVASASTSLARGAIHGLGMTNGPSDTTNDITIAEGKCRADTDTDDIVLTSSITKQLDSGWAEGSDAGGLDTGSIANTTYHVFLIKKSSDGTVDALFSASLSPTMPAGYDIKRRVGSIVRASAAIRQFYQRGDHFSLKTKYQERDDNDTIIAWGLITLAMIPTGLVLRVGLHIRYVFDALDGYVEIGDAEDTAEAQDYRVCIVDGEGGDAYLGYDVYCNTSAQIHFKIDEDYGFIDTYTVGWIDRRGQDD